MSNERFIVSEKKTPHGLLVVVTDVDILGKTVSEGKLNLDLTKTFYQGAEKNKEEVKELILLARYLHLTGKHAVAIGIELDLVDVHHILYVQNIPHAEVVIEN